MTKSLLQQALMQFPMATAIVHGSSAVSFQELAERVAGVHLPDDDQRYVATWLPLSLAHVEILLACWQSGRVSVPVNTRWPAGQVARRLRGLGCTFVITDQLELEGLSVFLPSDLARTSSQKQAETASRLDQPATVIYTSGSSGEPRAVLHLLANHYYSALGAWQNMPLGPGDRWLLSLPLYHVAGLGIVFRCLLAGASIIVAPEMPLERAIDTHNITHLSLVPTQLQRLMQACPICPPSLKAILLGGGAIPETLIRRAVEGGWPIHTTYGSTEMATQITTTKPGASLDELRTAGSVLPYRKLEIRDDDTIWVGGDTRCQGYIVDGELEDPADENGMIKTGDCGFIDEAGRLVVTGRHDAVFISGGENVHPEEIEKAMMTVPGVKRALVAPIPDAEFGHRPVAFVEADGKVDWDDALAERLPRYMFPIAYYPWPALGDTGGIKASRRILGEALLARWKADQTNTA